VRHSVLAAFIGVAKARAEQDEGDGLGAAHRWPGCCDACSAAVCCVHLKLARCKAASGNISLCCVLGVSCGTGIPSTAPADVDPDNTAGIIASKLAGGVRFRNNCNLQDNLD